MQKVTSGWRASLKTFMLNLRIDSLHSFFN